jgi:hypothetical protein
VIHRERVAGAEEMKRMDWNVGANLGKCGKFVSVLRRSRRSATASARQGRLEMYGSKREESSSEAVPSYLRGGRK